MPMPETDQVTVQIRLPLPTDVVAGLMLAIDKLWPGAVIVPDERDWFLAIRVTRQMISLDPDIDPADPGTWLDGEITAQHGSQWAFQGPEGWTKALGAMMFQMLDAHEGAVNYVETKVIDEPSGRESVVIVMAVDGKTPHELRAAAEARLEKYQRLARRIVGAQEAASPDEPPGHQLLDAIGELQDLLVVDGG